jgi:hypothetical protein
MKTYNYTLYHESLRSYNSLRILIIFRLGIGVIFCFISTYHKSLRSYNSLHNTYSHHTRLATVPSCPFIPLTAWNTFPRHGNIPSTTACFAHRHLTVHILCSFRDGIVYISCQKGADVLAYVTRLPLSWNVLYCYYVFHTWRCWYSVGSDSHMRSLVVALSVVAQHVTAVT